MKLFAVVLFCEYVSLFNSPFSLCPSKYSYRRLRIMSFQFFVHSTLYPLNFFAVHLVWFSLFVFHTIRLHDKTWAKFLCWSCKLLLKNILEPCLPTVSSLWHQKNLGWKRHMTQTRACIRHKSGQHRMHTYTNSGQNTKVIRVHLNCHICHILNTKWVASKENTRKPKKRAQNVRILE